MGQGQGSKGEKKVGTGAGGGGPSVGGPDGEDEALGTLVAETPDARGEVFGGELLAAAVEQDGVGAVRRTLRRTCRRGFRAGRLRW